jgi:hypothetical protein
VTSAAQVLATLGTGPKYAILDGARDKRIASLAQGELVRCLYRGTLPREVTDAAPHLMRLWPGNEPTERFFKQGWNESWGVLLAYTGPIKVLYRHLRKFLRVRGENGRAFAFRYYDPRVLRVYLPTCTPAEMERFFGPIEAFAAEDELPNAFHVFRRALRGFEQRRVSATDPGRLVRTWEHSEPSDRDGPLVLFRARQLRAFQERADERWARQMLRMMRKHHRDSIHGLSEAEVCRRCREALDRAAGHGLTGDDVLAFVLMTFTLSRRFDSHPAFRSVLADDGIPGDRKMSALYERLTPADWREVRGMA